MTILFPTLADLAKSDYLFRITDNGGATFDRYTAIYCDGGYVGMSKSPFHPQGFGQSGENIDVQRPADLVESGEEIDLALGDLPEECQRCVLSVVNQGWADFLAAGEAGEPSAVAPDRETASTYEGLMDQAGVGIYRGRDGKLHVKSDQSWGKADLEAEDPGPFETFHDAFLNTLPYAASMAGDEYHSTLDVNRLEPDPEVAAAVKALENRLGAKDDGYTVRQTAYGLPGERWAAVSPSGEDLEGEYESELEAWTAAGAAWAED